jgi:hypothetical protein
LLEALGQHPAFSYNSGKEKKWIDFILAWGIEKPKIQNVFLGNKVGHSLVPDMDYLPNSEVPSDHIPVTVIFQLP